MRLVRMLTVSRSIADMSQYNMQGGGDNRASEIKTITLLRTTDILPGEGKLLRT